MLKEYYVALAIIALAIVLAFIPAAFAASNENHSCVGNPNTKAIYSDLVEITIVLGKSEVK